MIPLLPGPAVLPHLPDLLSQNQEFAALQPITPENVAAVCRHGYMPMGLGSERPEILLIKCHRERMVLELPDLHVPRNVPRYARGLTVHVDDNLPTVLTQLGRYHEDSWISPVLAEAFQTLYARPIDGVSIHSIEVHDPTEPDDTPPLAAEIGYAVGDVYTSLTGYHTRNGSGWVQMVALGRLLQDCSAAFWDLGMDIPYKRRLGAHPMQRTAFLQRYQTASGGVGLLHARGPFWAHELVSRRP